MKAVHVIITPFQIHCAVYPSLWKARWLQNKQTFWDYTQIFCLLITNCFVISLLSISLCLSFHRHHIISYSADGISVVRVLLLHPCAHSGDKVPPQWRILPILGAGRGRPRLRNSARLNKLCRNAFFRFPRAHFGSVLSGPGFYFPSLKAKGFDTVLPGCDFTKI